MSHVEKAQENSSVNRTYRLPYQRNISKNVIYSVVTANETEKFNSSF